MTVRIELLAEKGFRATQIQEQVRNEFEKKEFKKFKIHSFQSDQFKIHVSKPGSKEGSTEGSTPDAA